MLVVDSDKGVRCGVLTQLQTEQCRQTPLPVHAGRANTFWTNRMPKAARLAAIRGQASGLSGDHVAAGREPGGPDAGDQLAEEV